MNIVFSVRAYAKLQWMYEKGCEKSVEVAGFAICPFEDDLLYIDNIVLLGQEVDKTSVEHSSQDITDHLLKYRKQYSINQFTRIHIHCHSGFKAFFSKTDENLFSEFSANTDWFVMGILGEDGLIFRAGLKTPIGNTKKELDHFIDWTSYNDFDINDSEEKWDEEFDSLVRLPKPKKSEVNYKNFNDQNDEEYLKLLEQEYEIELDNYGSGGPEKPLPKEWMQAASQYHV